MIFHWKTIKLSLELIISKTQLVKNILQINFTPRKQFLWHRSNEFSIIWENNFCSLKNIYLNQVNSLFKLNKIFVRTYIKHMFVRFKQTLFRVQWQFYCFSEEYHWMSMKFSPKWMINSFLAILSVTILKHIEKRFVK